MGRDSKEHCGIGVESNPLLPAGDNNEKIKKYFCALESSIEKTESQKIYMAPMRQRKQT